MLGSFALCGVHVFVQHGGADCQPCRGCQGCVVIGDDRSTSTRWKDHRNGETVVPLVAAQLLVLGSKLFRLDLATLSESESMLSESESIRKAVAPYLCLA